MKPPADTRAPASRGEPPERTVALELVGNDRVDFHFPVEIYLEEPAGPVDVHEIAEQVYERLMRRIDES